MRDVFMKAYIVCSHETTRNNLQPLLPQFHVVDKPPPERVDLLLRWGTGDGIDNAHVVLNPKKAVEASQFSHHVATALRTNRLTANVSTKAGPRYRVYMFDLRSFSIVRRVRGRWRFIRPKRRLRERLVIRSRRALYALGLTSGSVDIGITQRGRFYIQRIDSGPRLTDALSRRLAAAVTSFMDQRRYTAEGRDVVLGADPEFILRHRRTKRIVTANRFFPYRGTVGHDRLLARRLRGRPLAELRPAPSPDPHQVYRNIRNGVRRAMARTGWRIEFTAGSLPFPSFPIGGHIHFSKVSLTTKFIQALDTYLAVPLLLIDHPTRSWRRRLRYGYLGDFRFQHHGGFEYRSLPSWLVSPAITRAVLCMAKVIAHEYHRLPVHYLAQPAMQRAFYQADKVPFQRRFPDMWSHFTSVPTYKQYEQEIAPLKKLIDAQQVWPDRTDLKPRWFARRRRRSRRRRARRTRRARV